MTLDEADPVLNEQAWALGLERSAVPTARGSVASPQLTCAALPQLVLERTEPFA
jgi:hypothetical protein